MSDEVAWRVRKLMRAARCGTLATTARGAPFASLVTPATAPDLSILLLLSDLAEHTRHLHHDPRCAILLAGTPEDANPQTTPRVTLSGRAERSDDPALRARYLAIHPYAGLYAGFGDFHMWRVRLETAQFVGGFGRAARFGANRLLPEPTIVAAIAEAEAGIIAACSGEPMGIAGEAGEWRPVVLDADGYDIGSGERSVRFHWSVPSITAEAAQHELTRVSRRAEEDHSKPL